MDGVTSEKILAFIILFLIWKVGGFIKEDNNLYNFLLRGVWINYLLFLILGLLSYIWILRLSYGIDEFYNLQIPKNLVDNGIYATYYNLEYHLFDPIITTGPSTLFPIAFFFKLFGTNYIFSRFVMLIFFILMCIFIYIISCRLFNKRVAILSLLLIIFIPGIFNYLITYGEIPATLYFLIGFYFLLILEKNENKYIFYSLSGTFIAFSILSKLSR